MEIFAKNVSESGFVGCISVHPKFFADLFVQFAAKNAKNAPGVGCFRFDLGATSPAQNANLPLRLPFRPPNAFSSAGAAVALCLKAGAT